MALAFGQSSLGGTATGMNIQQGPDLEEITTEALGFLALSGESKVQLLPTPWTDLPPSTASLMSVASRQGLIAAAGPDVLVLASTETVRKAFEAPGASNTKSFQPNLSIPMPMRISQVAFSADESFLILSAEVGGGLAVYDVKSLLGNSTQTAFEMSTDGASLRALTPNPTPEKAELLALVTSGGHLMMANLKERKCVAGANGQNVLRDTVTCIAWSTKGKQLVAGLGNGTVCQMTPEGVVKGEIPYPPGLEADHHVSSITWLKNDVFLLVHTPTNCDPSQAPSSVFHVVSRQPKTSNFSFSKVAEPAGPFGMNRSPPHHFIARLRIFPPNLEDLLIIASTASMDIGLLSESKVPLTSTKPADKITGVFTFTEMSDDSRRAQLPATASLSDTSPIGVALDLSSKESVHQPIPGDEMSESATPLPALMVLNNEGVLASWWVVYTESIRERVGYPGLVALEGSQQPTVPQQTSQALATPFGAPASTAFGTSANAFGGPTALSSAFGGSKAAPAAFGSTGGLGKAQSPWGSSASTSTAAAGAPVFGSSTFGSASSTAPAFGTSTFGASPSSGPASGAPAFGAKPAFGSSALPGTRTSVWGSPATPASAASFGQENKPASVFGAGVAQSSSSGFAGFANTGGFSALAAPVTGGSVFGAKPTAPSTFSSTATAGTNSSLGLFGGQQNETPISTFGGTGSKFVLGSTFKADNAEKDMSEKPAASGTNFFGGGLENALNETIKPLPVVTPISTETDMDSDAHKPVETDSGTAATKSTFGSGLFGPTTPATATKPAAGLFGSAGGLTTQSQSTTGFSFGKPVEAAPSPFSKPVTPSSNPFSKPTANPFNMNGTTNDQSGGVTSLQLADVPTTSQIPSSPALPTVKQEPEDSPVGVSKSIPEAPLPPEPTSRKSYTDESAASSFDTADDAPLPPDFSRPSRARSSSVESAGNDALPPDFAPKPVVKSVQPESRPPTASSVDSLHHDSSNGQDGPEEDDKSSGLQTDDDEDDNDEEGEFGGDDSSSGGFTKELDTTSQGQNSVFSPSVAFGAPSNPNGGNGLVPTKVEARPRTLFGEIGSTAPKLPPPPKIPDSPRSPSPVRSAVPTRMNMRPEAARSVSAPHAASQILSSGKPSVSKLAAPSNGTFNASAQQHAAEEQRRAVVREKKESEETQPLIDEEDESMRRELAEQIVATKTLDEFLGRSEPVQAANDSVPAQVEAVFRDINAMIDTLGLNARSLKGFIKGHTELYKDDDRVKEDLEEEDDWCLDEIPRLSHLVEKALTSELNDGRILDVPNKIASCADLQKDFVRLSAKYEDVKKMYISHTHPEQLAAARAQPLSAEQAAQQSELRDNFMEFQKSLADAEEGLTMLRTKIVSSSYGKAAPTVEAVMRTITKMTNMAEQRSGDVDVLENQLKKLNFGSSGRQSREGSPFGTPLNPKMSFRNGGMSTSRLSFFTPENVRDSPSRLRSSMMSSIASPPRKKLSGYTEEEKTRLSAKLARRKEVTENLRTALRKAGTNVRTLDDDK